MRTMRMPFWLMFPLMRQSPARLATATGTVWAPSACSWTWSHQREDRSAERAQVGRVVGRATGAWRAGRGPGRAQRVREHALVSSHRTHRLAPR